MTSVLNKSILCGLKIDMVESHRRDGDLISLTFLFKEIRLTAEVSLCIP
jgi:hypothetical protein